MRVVTPRHIAAEVQDWTITHGDTKVRVSRVVALAVLSALWECDKRNTRIVWPRVEWTCETSGLCRATVQRALRSLEAQGFITALGKRNGGRAQPTVWGLVDNPVKGLMVSPFPAGKQPHGERKQPHGEQKGPHGEARKGLMVRHARKRELEERKEERMKSEHPLRLVDPPEPPRACRMPGCDRPALVGSRCLRHASGLPFPIPEPADGIPQRPERQEESA